MLGSLWSVATGHAQMSACAQPTPSGEVPLKDYAEGLYLARILLDGFVLGDTKFTVVK